MEEVESNEQCRDEYGGDFHDAPDDFPFDDCDDCFPERVELNGSVSVSDSDANPVAEDEIVVRRRRSSSRPKSPRGDSVQTLNLSSSVCLNDYVNSRMGKTSPVSKTEECKEKLENESSDAVQELRNCSDTLEELKHGSESVREDVVRVNNDEEKEESSSLTNADSDNVNRNELDLRRNVEADTGPLLTLASLMIKAVGFQFDLLVKCLSSPVWLSYYLFMLVFNPMGLLKSCKGQVLKVLKRIWSLVCENVIGNEWFKENQPIWKRAMKFGWGILWAAYVCTVLVTLLVLAFVMGGLVLRVAVQEPMRMQSNLNFDYTEKSPVAFVPIIAYPGMIHDVHVGDEHEIEKASGLRVIPPNHKLQATVTLTLPESDYNRNLGMFQVRVDFLANDGKTLASSRRPCMLYFKSQPVRLLLTFLKIAPILTGYASEIQNLKVSFKGFREGSVPTASLRVVIEQRAEFRPAAGIPEIYAASLTLESELPLLKKIVWFWRKTLFVWISLTIFIMELVFALLCCRPLIMPKIRMWGSQ